MVITAASPPAPAASLDEWHRACDTRDPGYDGVFFVAITSTRIYCRPICPSRAARPERRRFFLTTESAEQAGFRPCLRCRPDIEPGIAPVDALSRLARHAAGRIRAGCLDKMNVADLAAELGVSDRHLRRALEREFGASPSELAIAARLGRARELLVASSNPITRVAYDAGFGSLRRFNAVFRDRYHMTPSELRATSAKR